METAEKVRSKRRSQSAKVGRLKYNQQLLKRPLQEIQEVKLMQRTILAGLKGLFHFERPMIEKIACVDEVDMAILGMLFEAGGAGVLPRDLAARLSVYRVRRHQVSRRILRMNKRLKWEIGERVAEKRGWRWALTGFGFEVEGQEKREVTVWDVLLLTVIENNISKSICSVVALQWIRIFL
jgi:hypothetical protein